MTQVDITKSAAIDDDDDRHADHTVSDDVVPVAEDGGDGDGAAAAAAAVEAAAAACTSTESANSNETYIDAHFMAETGFLDVFLMASQTPAGITRTIWLLSGKPVSFLCFCLLLSQCAANFL